MITPKLLYNYLFSDEEYNKCYDELVKKDTYWWEEDINKYALNPTEEELQKTKEVMKYGHRDWKRMAF